MYKMKCVPKLLKCYGLHVFVLQSPAGHLSLLKRLEVTYWTGMNTDIRKCQRFKDELDIQT